MNAKPPKTITNSLGMQLVLIPVGHFKMGSTDAEREVILGIYGETEFPDWLKAEKPRHEVVITKAFYMGAHEVTQAQYQKIIGKNPSWFSHGANGDGAVKGMTTDEFPVDSVNWHDAVEFCQKLTVLEKNKGHERMYRLPTEAEWEYAGRAGTSSPFHYGASLSSAQANFDGNKPYGQARKGQFLERTCKVGSYKPNNFGLYDMHGNVWEWCYDWYDIRYYQKSVKKDPSGPTSGEYRVLRGGSCFSPGDCCRSAYRVRFKPNHRSFYTGFRVVCVPAPTNK
jgi:formylglycine-generating enzyme required for sulfatase activity